MLWLLATLLNAATVVSSNARTTSVAHVVTTLIVKLSHKLQTSTSTKTQHKLDQ
jgi:hypothetical protein